MMSCQMEHAIDCRATWSAKQTSQGSCLVLDTNQAYNFEIALNQFQNDLFQNQLDSMANDQAFGNSVDKASIN